MAKGKKYILYLFVAAVCTAAGVGYYYYNKGPVNIKNASGIKTEAPVLYQSFARDSSGAKKMFLNKILLVSGVVKKVSKNQENKDVILLQTSEADAYINCTFEEAVSGIAENSPVTVKGICTGMGMGDADLGITGDVYLVRCYLQ